MEIDLSLIVKNCNNALTYSLLDTNNDENNLLSVVETATHLRVSSVAETLYYWAIPFKIKMENLGGRSFTTEVKTFYSICANP